MPTADLAIEIRDADDGVRVMDLEGAITALSEAAITASHAEAGRGARAVILNFERVDYMNSGGIGLLVTTLIRAQREGHDLRAYGLSEHYREIFALTRLDEVISVFDDEGAALAAGSPS